MAEEKIKKSEEQLQEEQLDDVNGGMTIEQQIKLLKQLGEQGEWPGPKEEIFFKYL